MTHLEELGLGPLGPEVGHDGRQDPVAGALARARRPHQRRAEADVEDVEDLLGLGFGLGGRRNGGEVRRSADWVGVGDGIAPDLAGRVRVGPARRLGDPPG